MCVRAAVAVLLVVQPVLYFYKSKDKFVVPQIWVIGCMRLLL